MGSGRGKSAKSDKQPTAEQPSYTVTGTLTPNATGNYYRRGMLNGKRWYRRTDKAFYIWWSDANRWILSTENGEDAGARWWHVDPEIVGIYLTPNGGAIGVATVSAYGA